MELELVTRVNRQEHLAPTIVFEFSDVMRNTRQGPMGSEGSEDPTLQQIMKTMRALQATNEEAKAD